jgi:hypothetical protein
MKRHLERKLGCPKKYDVELTEDIRGKILRDRVYHLPKQSKVTNIINNNNITNNNQTNINIEHYVAKTPPDIKINKLLSHFNQDMPNIQENPYFRRMRRSLISHKDNPDPDKKEECRHIDDIFKTIIDFLQSFCEDDEDDHNVYNCFIKSNIFHLFDDDEWQKRTIPKGMKHLIKILKTMMFDAYEVCLIRQMKNWKLRQKAKESLKDYYSLIYSFDNLPTFMEERNNDNRLLYNKNDNEYDNPAYDSYEYIDQLSSIWSEVRKEMKEYKINKNNSQLKQIITHHSDKTIATLNDKLLNELKGNTEFQNTLMTESQI